MEKEGFRLRVSGLGGVEEKAGVSAPGFGEPVLVEDVAESLVDVLAISGERLSLGIAVSDVVVFGMLIGSDILLVRDRHSTARDVSGVAGSRKYMIWQRYAEKMTCSAC